MSIQVLVVDDHLVFRDGLSALLGSLPDIEVTATTADGPEAIVAAETMGVDVVVMDLNLPSLSPAWPPPPAPPPCPSRRPNWL